MSSKNRQFPSNVAVIEETPQVPVSATVNNTLTYRREHPGNRCSYGIAGVPGIVVFDRGLFADPTFNGNITVDVPLALPQADGKMAKAEAVAARQIERAAKAQARIEAASEKARLRQEKADAALASAKAKAEAAAAALKNKTKETVTA